MQPSPRRFLVLHTAFENEIKLEEYAAAGIAHDQYLRQEIYEMKKRTDFDKPVTLKRTNPEELMQSILTSYNRSESQKENE